MITKRIIPCLDVRDGRVKAEEPAAPSAKKDSNEPKVIYVQDLLK